MSRLVECCERLQLIPGAYWLWSHQSYQSQHASCPRSRHSLWQHKHPDSLRIILLWADWAQVLHCTELYQHQSQEQGTACWEWLFCDVIILAMASCIAVTLAMVVSRSLSRDTHCLSLPCSTSLGKIVAQDQGRSVPEKYHHNKKIFIPVDMAKMEQLQVLTVWWWGNHMSTVNLPHKVCNGNVFIFNKQRCTTGKSERMQIVW